MDCVSFGNTRTDFSLLTKSVGAQRLHRAYCTSQEESSIKPCTRSSLFNKATRRNQTSLSAHLQAPTKLTKTKSLCACWEILRVNVAPGETASWLLGKHVVVVYVMRSTGKGFMQTPVPPGFFPFLLWWKTGWQNHPLEKRKNSSVLPLLAPSAVPELIHVHIFLSWFSPTSALQINFEMITFLFLIFIVEKTFFVNELLKLIWPTRKIRLPSQTEHLPV